MSRATICIAMTASLVVACESDDLGQPCGTTPTEVTDPIGGEVPVVEVVRIERDGECESFQCLTHRGLPPYCTRECELTPPEDAAKRCSADTDCTGGDFRSGAQGHCVEGKCVCEEDFECVTKMHCAGGVCSDDDCPKGFWCKNVQEVGPLLGKSYCVFKDGCADDDIYYCEDLGNIECQMLACFNACLREYWVCRASEEIAFPDTCDDLGCFSPCLWQGGSEYFCSDAALDGKSDDPEDKKRASDCRDAGCYDATLCAQQLRADCTFDRLICEPMSNLVCHCQNAEFEIPSCPTEQLICQANSSQADWGEGAVDRVGMCLPKDL